jgi:hypothetical protein
MKHLRLYEELMSNEIKKYFVWKQNRYEILELDYNDVENISQYNKIWVYDFLYFDGYKFIDNKSFGTNWITLDSPYLLFSSDDLEECKNYILFSATQNKYNL